MKQVCGHFSWANIRKMAKILSFVLSPINLLIIKCVTFVHECNYLICVLKFIIYQSDFNIFEVMEKTMTRANHVICFCYTKQGSD